MRVNAAFVATRIPILLVFVFVFSSLPCEAQQSSSSAELSVQAKPIYLDTNGDGVINDDEGKETEWKDYWATVRATAPKSDLVTGYYVTISDAVSERLTFSFVCVYGGEYFYFHVGMQSGFMETGKTQFSDGWLKVRHDGSSVGDHYLHPHRSGGRNFLFTESAWRTWHEKKRLDPGGVLVKLSRDDFGRLLPAMPSSENVFASANEDGLSAESFLAPPVRMGSGERREQSAVQTGLIIEIAGDAPTNNKVQFCFFENGRWDSIYVSTRRGWFEGSFDLFQGEKKITRVQIPDLTDSGAMVPLGNVVKTLPRIGNGMGRQADDRAIAFE